MNEVMAPTEEVQMQACSLSDICRLCANLHDIMIPIYADEGVDHMLESKIKTHLPFINICENDLLPKKVCYQCASAILVWNEVYETSSDADQKLRNMCEVTSFDQGEQCKNVPYDENTPIHIEGIHVPVKNFIGESIQFEDITDVHMFNKNEKSNKTLNDLDKVPSTSKSDTILNHESKSPVIQQDERLNPVLKRYIDMSEPDTTMKIVTTKENTLANNYYCSFCHEKFLKIRDKVKHDRDVHGINSNLLPIKYVSDRYIDDNLKIENVSGDHTDTNLSSLVNINEPKITQEFKSDNCDVLCTVCSISFKSSLEKLEHDQKSHGIQSTTRRSKRVAASKSYEELFNEECDYNTEVQTNSLDSELFTDNCNVLINDNNPKSDDIEVNKGLVKLKKEALESGKNSDDENFKCYYCNKQFTNKYVALKHVRSHMVNDKKPIPKNDNYDKYKVMIDDKLYYKCDQCNYAVEGRRYKFVYHMRVHTGEKPYTCEMCSKQFRTAAFLRRHIVCFHEKIRSYQCDICGRSFSEKRNVDDHRRTHTGERPFVCETCGKSFAQRSSMKIHWKQMHESIKSHKCQYCDKSFIRRCHLVAHLTHHTGVRNYVCAVCGKAFLRSGTLKGHTAVHSTERPFQCPICGDTFKLKKHLKQHGRVHENQRSFESVPQLEFIPHTPVVPTSEIHNN